MLQSSVSSSFNTWHHGGTWFVSCLFFCYLATPFGIAFIKQLNKKQCIVGIVIAGMIVSYMQLAVHVLEYDWIYANVIYRCLEFLIGMQLARMYAITGQKEKYSRKKIYICLVFMLLIIVAGLCVLDMTVGSYLDYGFFVIPAFTLLLWLALFIRCGKVVSQIMHSKMMRYANKFAYEFFLAQFFCFNITKKISDVLSVDNSAALTVIALVICIIIAVALHELVTHPGKQLLLKAQKIQFYKKIGME